MKILCIGEAMLEISLTETDNATVRFAGDTLNTAVYLQRLSSNANKVSYCTVVGQDALSDRMIGFIQSEDIDTSTIDRNHERTVGLYAISTDGNGERSFTYWRNQSAAKTLFQQNEQPDFSALTGFDLIYLSAITLAILPAAMRQALLEELSSLRQSKDVLIAFDSNYRPALWESQSSAAATIESFWNITDIALPSIDDELEVFNDSDEESLINRFRSYGVTQGGLKRGAAGPVGLGAQPVMLPDKQVSKVKVIDSTAAGDSFNAGYLYAFTQGASQQEALLQGHQLAARVITHHGAIVPKSEW